MRSVRFKGIRMLTHGGSDYPRFRVVANVDTLRQVKDIFGNVGGMIGDPLQIPHNGNGGTTLV